MIKICGGKTMKKLRVVGAAITDENKVLAARRGESKYAYVAHKYEFVGGKVEEGEEEPRALEREVYEELGARAKAGSLLMRVQYAYPDFEIELAVYFCTLLTPYRKTEHEELRWIPFAELKEEEWAPADAPVVRRLKEGGAADLILQ